MSDEQHKATPDTVDYDNRVESPTIPGILGGFGVDLPQAQTGSHPLSEQDSTLTDTQESWAVSVPDAALGRYQVLREIGRGGMGRVLEATDPELGRVVAIKILLNPREVRHDQLQRFVAEARITSQLEHPNIIPVHDLGVTTEGQLYLVMKRVEGEGLDIVLDRLAKSEFATLEHWTRRRLLTIFVQLCNAVGYAHERGVLHRDLKPSNVMVGQFGEVLLMDWGVARVLAQVESKDGDQDTEQSISLAPNSKRSTLDGATVGTPGYLAPEQASGIPDAVGPFSDVWSLGAILYELLTYRQAFVGQTALQLLFVAAKSEPEDPRSLAAQLSIPDEIAEICMRSLARDPTERYATALELGQAVEAFLEGSRRKEAAALHVAKADETWGHYRQLNEERGELATKIQMLADAVPSWATLREKEELLAARDRLEALSYERIDLFESVITSCEQALTHDPQNPGAYSLLSDVHFSRFEEAESVGDLELMRAAERRVMHYDDGRLAPLIRGVGAVTLRTNPPGAEVLCQEIFREGLVWKLGRGRSLGRTPLLRIPMEKGSYLLTLKKEGKEDTRYPIFIGRGVQWDSGPTAIPLFSRSQIGDGFRYVPAGLFRAGGDPSAPGGIEACEVWEDGFFISESPITMQQWCLYINDLHCTQPELASSRLPRFDNQSPYWHPPDEEVGYSVPVVDRDGDAWDPNFPVFGVSWDDSAAYAEWAAQRSRRPLSIPTERQWEKSARGVDGRYFPWGDRFDASLCKMLGSREVANQVEPIGCFPQDISVYGVADLAGTIREWAYPCWEDAESDRRVARGGSWYSSRIASCRAATRSLHPTSYVATSIGLRLVCQLPASEPKSR